MPPQPDTPLLLRVNGPSDLQEQHARLTANRVAVALHGDPVPRPGGVPRRNPHAPPSSPSSAELHHASQLATLRPRLAAARIAWEGAISFEDQGDQTRALATLRRLRAQVRELEQAQSRHHASPVRPGVWGLYLVTVPEVQTHEGSLMEPRTLPARRLTLDVCALPPGLQQTVQDYLHSPHTALPWQYHRRPARLYPNPNATDETRALMLALARLLPGATVDKFFSVPHNFH